jgi:chemotaxis signal transduction protein
MAQAIQYLTFGVDKERFALPVEQVQEILDLPMRPIMSSGSWTCAGWECC